MTDASVLGALAVVLAHLSVRGARRWWAGCLTLRRSRPHGRTERPVPAFVGRALLDAGVDDEHHPWFHRWVVAVAAAAVGGLVVPGLGVVALVLGIGPPVAVLACRHRGAAQRRAHLPLALDAMAASMRGGASLRGALDEGATLGPPLGDELATMARHAGAGRPVAVVVARWAEAAPDPETRLAGAALTMAASLGGPGADALEATAESLRDRAAATAEVTSLSVQARLSAGVLAAAPLGFALLLVTLDPTSARFLVTTPAGLGCLALGLTLDAVGARWMARLVRNAR